MGKDLKAQITYFPHFSWSQQNPGHQSPHLEGLPGVRARLSGASLPSSSAGCCGRNQMDPVARNRWERAAGTLLSGQEIQNPGSGPVPWMGSAQGLCSVESRETACPNKARDWCTFPPHREECVEWAIRNGLTSYSTMVTGLSKEMCQGCWGLLVEV